MKVNPNNVPGFYAELSADQGYYYQLKYYAEALVNDRPITTATAHSTMGSIEILEAEIESADRNGVWG
ncbi:hypothetical protein [Paenibacillus sedimenti]|uniref:Uncharacterized protein n=1 Tax=Paenibacillus sedimenti TaxID=2770274 RepID=A0A926QLZ6_9BACL|nr:hypothetical protein [Paenibacillus sedimenti]MBD0382899.1 hypothetical protein [Paenibacillus sedimenti]